MIRLILAQLRFRRGRSVATTAAVLVAVASFALLFSAARQSRLELTGTVTQSARPQYDLMVRPAGAVTPVEQNQNLVQSGQLSGMSGGISTAQWRQIAGLRDVAVAAPIAVGGYVIQYGRVKVDLTPFLTSGADQQLLRINQVFVADGGASRIPDGPIYLYVTRNRLDSPDGGAARELGVEVCRSGSGFADTNLPPSQRRNLVCWSTDPSSAYYATEPGMSGTHPFVFVQFGFPLLVVGVDPEQEAKLDGLDRAVVAGRYLTAADGPGSRRIVVAQGNPKLPVGAYTSPTIPMLLAAKTQVDERLDLTVERVDATDLVTSISSSSVAMNAMDERPGTVVGHVSVAAQTAYADVVAETTKPHTNPTDFYPEVNHLVSTGPVQLAAGLRAQVVPPSAQLVAGPFDYGGWQNPIDLEDVMVRPFVEHSSLGEGYGEGEDGEFTKKTPELDAVGQIDPDLIATGAALTQAPMDIAEIPGATAADDSAQTALGDRLLLPSSNLGGLIAQRPSIITTLYGLTLLTQDPFTRNDPAHGVDLDEPISMVRVRLTGDVGLDDLSTERLRAVADRIQEITGLRVDVVVGASPSNVDVSLPAGKFGRPAMTVAEPWSKKGVAAVIVKAVDRKSALLAILVLVACGLAVANATSAAVRTRRTELGVLSCLGWSRRRLFALVLGETSVIGSAAGLLGTAASFAAASALGIEVERRTALLCIPAAIVLTGLAGLGPALRATRAEPAVAVRPIVAGQRRGPDLRGVGGLALRNFARTPGRTALGALSLAVGMTAVVLLAVIDLAFQGSVTGTLLGNAITVQAAPTDYLAAAITAVMGAVSVADVLYVNVRERSAEFALLRSTGWADRSVALLLTYEALLLSGIGAMAGSAFAVGLTGVFASHITSAVYAIAAACAAGGVLLALGAAAVPIRMTRSIPAARLLAEE